MLSFLVSIQFIELLPTHTGLLLKIEFLISSIEDTQAYQSMSHNLLLSFGQSIKKAHVFLSSFPFFSASSAM